MAASAKKGTRAWEGGVSGMTSGSSGDGSAESRGARGWLGGVWGCDSSDMVRSWGRTVIEDAILVIEVPVATRLGVGGAQNCFSTLALMSCFEIKGGIRLDVKGWSGSMSSWRCSRIAHPGLLGSYVIEKTVAIRVNNKALCLFAHK